MFDYNALQLRNKVITVNTMCYSIFLYFFSFLFLTSKMNECRLQHLFRKNFSLVTTIFFLTNWLSVNWKSRFSVLLLSFKCASYFQLKKCSDFLPDMQTKIKPLALKLTTQKKSSESMNLRHEILNVFLHSHC
jgi:hypothetical protein